VSESDLDFRQPSEVAATRDREGGQGRARVPVVRLFPWIGGFAVIAVLFGRALSPSFKGVGTGLGRLIQAVDIAGVVLSYDFIFVAVPIAVVSGLTFLSSEGHRILRVATVVAGGFALVPTAWALHNPLSDLAAAALGIAASCFGLGAAWIAYRAPFARVPALVLGLVSAGSLFRTGGVALAITFCDTTAHGRASAVVTWAATVAFACDTLGIASAVAWIAACSKRVTSPTTIVVLFVALVLTRQALCGGRGDDGHVLNLLLWGASERLMSSPTGSAPLAFRVFIAFLAPLTAIALLMDQRTLPPFGAAVALALAGHGAVEMPPCAWMVILAALAMALVSNNPRAMWDALGPPESRPEAS
jgi:hypothetical protein